MGTASFRRLHAGFGRLSAGQARVLRQRLAGLDVPVALRVRTETGRAAPTGCRHCGGAVLQRWGETRTGLQRLRCKTCSRTFSSASGSALARLRRPEAFLCALDDMMGSTPSSCRRLAARLGVGRMSVWRWRHILLLVLAKPGAAAGAALLGGIVEVRESILRESRKGSREWVNYLRRPDLFPAPDRPRWEDCRSGRAALPDPARFQVPVLLLADREGGGSADMLTDRSAATRG